MNNYVKLLLDEIQANANVISKYVDSTDYYGRKMNVKDNIHIKCMLEAIVDNLDSIVDDVKTRVERADKDRLRLDD